MASSASLVPDSLDLYRLCATPGCEWMVRFPEPVRCFRHGGAPFPQYLPADDGGFLDTDFMPTPNEAWD